MLEWATLQVKLFLDIHCKDPGLVDKAQTRTQHRETFLYAETVIYYCDHGYKDVNAPHQDSAITLRCSKYGNWSRELPKCESKSLKSWSMIFTNISLFQNTSSERLYHMSFQYAKLFTLHACISYNLLYIAFDHWSRKKSLISLLQKFVVLTLAMASTL